MDDVREGNEVVDVALTESGVQINGGQLLPFPTDRIQILRRNSQVIIQDIDGNLLAISLLSFTLIADFQHKLYSQWKI